ncbi:MAG: hypothetical protein DHS20C09_20760 [marine bacterium B5-7]|nr:MAG: hypothetical protein DHS20C09_20760 [marine bacterium B5-7]
MFRLFMSFLIMTLTTINASADVSHQGGLEACMLATTAIRTGTYTKVEYLGFTDEGVSAYEIEMKDLDGKVWEFECDARSGEIIEIEQEVANSDAPLFKKKMKVSEKKAQTIATDLYPGTIEEVEYEIESNGQVSYEFDIVDKYGVEFKIEVDATSGDIVEVQIEKWQIGAEDNK